MSGTGVETIVSRKGKNDMTKIEVIHRTKEWPKPEIGPHAFPWPHTDTITEVYGGERSWRPSDRWVFIKRESKDKVGYRIETGPRNRPTHVWPNEAHIATSGRKARLFRTGDPGHTAFWSTDGYKASVKFEKYTGMGASGWKAIANHWN